MSARRNSFRGRVIASVNHLFLKMQHKLGVCLLGGKPISAMIELCNVCNLTCPLCPSGNSQLKRKTGMMEEDVFKAIVDQLDDRYTRDFIPAMWGESLLHPKFLQFMNYARKKSWRISVSTNGNIRGDASYCRDLVATGIDEIICAVDGHNQETYSMYRRGGSIEKVYNFLKNVKKARDKLGVDKPELVGQIHLFRFNENHIAEIKCNIEAFVDSIQTKTTRIFYTDLSKISSIKSMYTDFKPDKDENQFKPMKRRKCPWPLYSVFMNWEGDVIACCKDPENILKFGNITDESLNTIRSSRTFIDTKKKFLRGIFEEEICRKCLSY